MYLKKFSLQILLILYNICVTNNKQDIDFSRVDKVLQLVELYDFVYSKKDKYLSFIGENGKNFQVGKSRD